MELLRTFDSLSERDQAFVLGQLRAAHPIHQLESRWGASAEVILEAIARASDLSHRGVLGLIAEATFKLHVIDAIQDWKSLPVPQDAAFDFLIERGGVELRIQVKRQRQERGAPKQWRPNSPLFVVETQRTRSGKTHDGEDTRPYKVGEFDILAVSMQPSTDDWACFRFAPQQWLLRREDKPGLLRVMQPVALEECEDWTGSLDTCIERVLSRRQRTISSPT